MKVIYVNESFHDDYCLRYVITCCYNKKLLYTQLGPLLKLFTSTVGMINQWYLLHI